MIKKWPSETVKIHSVNNQQSYQTKLLHWQ